MIDFFCCQLFEKYFRKTLPLVLLNSFHSHFYISGYFLNAPEKREKKRKPLNIALLVTRNHKMMLLLRAVPHFTDFDVGNATEQFQQIMYPIRYFGIPMEILPRVRSSSEIYGLMVSMHKSSLPTISLCVFILSFYPDDFIAVCSVILVLC